MHAGAPGVGGAPLPCWLLQVFSMLTFAWCLVSIVLQCGDVF